MIAEEQKQISVKACVTLTKVHTPVAGVSLLTNKDGKIVLPITATDLIVAI